MLRLGLSPFRGALRAFSPRKRPRINGPRGREDAKYHFYNRGLNLAEKAIESFAPKSDPYARGFDLAEKALERVPRPFQAVLVDYLRKSYFLAFLIVSLALTQFDFSSKTITKIFSRSAENVSKAFGPDVLIERKIDSKVNEPFRVDPKRGKGAAGRTDPKEFLVDQKNEILNYMKADAVMNCLVVDGIRGTGKSWTIQHALEEFSHEPGAQILYIPLVRIASEEDFALAISHGLGLDKGGASIVLAFEGLSLRSSQPEVASIGSSSYTPSSHLRKMMTTLDQYVKGKGDAAKGGAAEEGAAKGDAAKGDAAKGDAAKGDAAKGDSAEEDAAEEDAAEEDDDEEDDDEEDADEEDSDEEDADEEHADEDPTAQQQNSTRVQNPFDDSHIEIEQEPVEFQVKLVIVVDDLEAIDRDSPGALSAFKTFYDHCRVWTKDNLARVVFSSSSSFTSRFLIEGGGADFLEIKPLDPKAAAKYLWDQIYKSSRGECKNNTKSLAYKRCQQMSKEIGGNLSDLRRFSQLVNKAKKRKGSKVNLNNSLNEFIAQSSENFQHLMGPLVREYSRKDITFILDLFSSPSSVRDLSVKLDKLPNKVALYQILDRLIKTQVLRYVSRKKKTPDDDEEVKPPNKGALYQVLDRLSKTQVLRYVSRKKKTPDDDEEVKPPNKGALYQVLDRLSKTQVLRYISRKKTSDDDVEILAKEEVLVKLEFASPLLSRCYQAWKASRPWWHFFSY